MNGNGVDDIVVLHQDEVAYIELGRGMAASLFDPPPYAPRPGLLVKTSNGLGATTELAYTTTPIASEKARHAKQPWSSESIQAMPVVTRVVTRNNLPGRPTTIDQEYVYRDPVFDGLTQAFMGFRTVAQITKPDATHASISTVESEYYYPDCQSPSACWQDDERLRAAFGMLVRQEVYEGAGPYDANKGRYLSTAAHQLTLRALLTGSDGRKVSHAYASRSDTLLYDHRKYSDTSQTQAFSLLVDEGGGELAATVIPIRAFRRDTEQSPQIGPKTLEKTACRARIPS
jgi:hypothetical protein